MRLIIHDHPACRFAKYQVYYTADDRRHIRVGNFPKRFERHFDQPLRAGRRALPDAGALDPTDSFHGSIRKFLSILAFEPFFAELFVSQLS